MKRLAVDFGLVILLTIVLIGTIFYFKERNYPLKKPIAVQVEKIIEKPLEKYTFENLRNTTFPPYTLTLGKELPTNKKSIESRVFYYSVADPKDEHKTYKVSGLLNMPSEEGEYPVIVMFRGFVERLEYKTGIGTRRAGEVLASNGFITLAPDFLGFAESDKPSENSIEERFQTYTTALSLFSSLSNLNSALEATHSGKIKADITKIGIWGHSNGGHISLSVLALSGKTYPTVLWNPVTKPFPYSILYFTDEFDDEGKALRKVVSDFEQDYDIFLYSPPKYYSWIQAPIQLHQGEADESVPVRWSDQFVKNMQDDKKDIEYFTYKDADHNLMPGGWDMAMKRSMEFYIKEFKRNNKNLTY